MEVFKKIAEITREAFFPSWCVACRRVTLADSSPQWWLCSPCRRELTSSFKTICPNCDKEVGFGSRVACAHEPGALANVSFLFRYEQPTVRALIQALKYRYLTGVAETFSDFLGAERLNLLRLPAELIVPLPLHARRERERGFNQSELIARLISEVVGRPLVAGALIKARPSRAQMKIKTPRQRERNIRGVFRVVSPEAVRGKNVLLVDDVITTGATLEEAARTLRAAGARRIFGLVLAKD